MLGEAENLELPVVLVKLPPFPVVAIKALQIASESEMRLSELHQIICTDQVFSTELLRAANSPLYATRSPITSTLQATIRLGYESLRRLVLTVGIRGYLGKVLEIPTLRACWRHSLACAIVAEELAIASFAAKSEPQVNLDKDFAYTAGIIHDIGRLALAVWKPKPYADFLNSTAKEPGNFLAQEKQLFGADHCQVGRSLVKKWALPAAFLEITSRHHDDMRSRQFDALAVVHVSCMVSDTLGFEVAHCTGAPTYEEVISELPEGVRERFSFSREEYASRIATKINSIETT
jgi:HD-like signal output (HDOD) protein